MSIRNEAAEPAPAGLGWHPYFPKRTRSRLHAEVSARWESDSATQLPTRRVPQSGIDGDVAHLDFDHCFEGWQGMARLRDEKLGLRLSSSLPYLVVFTPQQRDYWCVEPVSHVSNAVHMSDPAAHGLRTLMPGETFEAWMRAGGGPGLSRDRPRPAPGSLARRALAAGRVAFLAPRRAGAVVVRHPGPAACSAWTGAAPRAATGPSTPSPACARPAARRPTCVLAMRDGLWRFDAGTADAAALAGRALRHRARALQRRPGRPAGPLLGRARSTSRASPPRRACTATPAGASCARPAASR
jgi:hypothetical protein